ncbi:hypothetical protein [Ramlibacter albus]|uniref:Uncharacterized protein n=1 Tax=Ramlibacter albus TaxID=2079448 RepID=A0A923M4M2_9BURK|nr:hypothetical protein [Ramlibacter albus]MBC5763818.1 hypothetical protein [Ramlibacter albus]
MGLHDPTPTLRRRHFVLGALASAVLPRPAAAAEIRTPSELAELFRREVIQKLDVPRSEALLYGSMTEMQLPEGWQGGNAPQYLLAVDKNVNIQVAFLYWRLMPGHYQLVGAAPASTGALPANETPDGVFERTSSAAVRELEFMTRRPSFVAGRMQQCEVRLCARAADSAAIGHLGQPHSDGCVLLPPSMLAFVERHGVLDATRPTPKLPYPGRVMVVIDSERVDRPEWCDC